VSWALTRRVIQRRLGHASIRTTFDVYGAVLPEVDNEVTDKMADLFDGRVTCVSARRAHEPQTGADQYKCGGGERTRTAGLFVANPKSDDSPTSDDEEFPLFF
jgi:hypothetical protein